MALQALSVKLMFGGYCKCARKLREFRHQHCTDCQSFFYQTMPNKRTKSEVTILILRQVEVLMGQGMSRLDAIRQNRIVGRTYHGWRKQLGGWM